MRLHNDNCYIYCNKKTIPGRFYMQVYLGEGVTNTTEAWKTIQRIIQNQK
jgi:hypothetical protein